MIQILPRFPAASLTQKGLGWIDSHSSENKEKEIEGYKENKKRDKDRNH